MYWLKRKIWQIKNIFRWLPIIWKQYDFDYHYSIEVFKFQLQKQAEFLESDKALTTSAKDRAKRIRTILKLMDKVYAEEYAMEYQDILKEMYGKDVLETELIPFQDGSELKTLKFRYESWDNAEEISQIKDKLFQMSIEKQNRAHKILWAIIEKDIQTWWD